MPPSDYQVKSILPASIDAERAILGAILLDAKCYDDAAEHLAASDFSLDSHRRIYSRMISLAEQSHPIDMITLVEELDRHRDLQAIGDVGYVASLLDGVPDRPSIEHYVKIVRDKALLRGLIHAANTAISRACDQSDPAEDVLRDTEEALFQLSDRRVVRGFLGVSQIIQNSFGSIDALFDRGQRVTGLATHYADLDEMTSGLQQSELVIIAARPSLGKTSLAMNIAENAAVLAPQGGRRLFAGDVAGGAADAPAVLARPRGHAEAEDGFIAGRARKLTRRSRNSPRRRSSSTTRPA